MAIKRKFFTKGTYSEEGFFDLLKRDLKLKEKEKEALLERTEDFKESFVKHLPDLVKKYNDVLKHQDLVLKLLKNESFDKLESAIAKLGNAADELNEESDEVLLSAFPGIDELVYRSAVILNSDIETEFFIDKSILKKHKCSALIPKVPAEFETLFKDKDEEIYMDLERCYEVLGKEGYYGMLSSTYLINFLAGI